MIATDPVTLETSRGFHVHVHAPPSKYRRKAQILRYPTSGCAPFTGKQAIGVLEALQKRGHVCHAWTTSPDPNGETLTLAEMRELIL